MVSLHVLTFTVLSDVLRSLTKDFLFDTIFKCLSLVVYFVPLVNSRFMKLVHIFLTFVRNVASLRIQIEAYSLTQSSLSVLQGTSV